MRLKEQRKQQKEKDDEEKVERKKRREERKKKEQEREEEKMKKAVGGCLAHRRYTCAVCGERGRVNDELNGVMWYGCDESMCGRWFHEECLSQSESILGRVKVMVCLGIVLYVSRGYMRKSKRARML